MSALRHTLRSLAKAPGFTFVVVASLGLGVGATTTAFSWIDSFLLNPLPAVPASNELVSVYTKGPGGAEWSVAYPRFKRWRDAVSGAVPSLAVFSGEQLSLRFDQFGPERVWSNVVSGNFFDVLEVRAAHGRTLTEDDERTAAQVAVISDRLWDRVFRRDPGTVGKPVAINGQGFTIVGIAPPKFAGAMTGLALDLWVPVTTMSVLDPGNERLTSDNWQWLESVARISPGSTLAQARSALDLASRQVAQATGEQTPTLAGVRSLSDTGAGQFIKPLFLTLFGLAGIILLIACANIANLLLVRAIQQNRELGVRVALGASRGQVVRHLMTESLVLAALGGTLGVVLSFWGRGLLAAVVPDLAFPINLASEINLRVVGMASVVTLGTALLVGLLPAIRASRPSLVDALKNGQRAGSTRSLLRNGLVVAQVALSLIALVSAGLFFRSLRAARAADPGFRDPGHVLVAGTDFRLAGYQSAAARPLLDRALERIRALPGVRAASTTDDLPMMIGNNSSTSAEPEGYRFGPDENQSIDYARVGQDFFAAMGVPIKAGRGITAADRTDTPPSMVINEAFAKRYLANRDPLGAKVVAQGRDWTVVGVVPNVVKERPGETPTPFMYLAATQSFAASIFFIVRTEMEPRSIIEPVRSVLQSIDPNLPLLDPRTMEASMAGGLFIQSMGASILAFLGMIALALAAIGLYGVLSFAVSQRTREIGVRMALGAGTASVVRMVALHASRLLGIGLVLGGGLGLAVGVALRSQLFGVEPADPVTFVAVAGVLALVAVAAAVVPARRASRVDPVVTLKAE